MNKTALTKKIIGNLLIAAGIISLIFIGLAIVQTYYEIRFSVPPGETTSRGRTPPNSIERVFIELGMRGKGIYKSRDYTDWVWAVKPEYHTGTKVKLEIAHAAAGEEGGFRMIAYGDSNKDGKPDKLIAQSPFMTTEREGGWSEWEFETEEKPLFVGFNWPLNNYIYRRGGIWPHGMFSDDFYYGLAAKKFIPGGPAFSNVRISFSGPPPSAQTKLLKNRKKEKTPIKKFDDSIGEVFKKLNKWGKGVYKALNYSDWVWEVKPEYQTGKKVKLMVAHAAAREDGGFWMIACADSNKDGKPDKVIAKSLFMTAKEPGEWSNWEFETEEKPLFVGFEWPLGTYIYRRGGNWPSGIFANKFFYGVETKKFIPGGPAFSNMKISFSN